jgi:carboxymethylenebutenolidase
MEDRKRMPAEAVELYSQFIHGEISRRAFMDGLKRYAIAGLTVSAMMDALMPNYALGQQGRKEDERITASYETVPSPTGNGFIRGYFVRPTSQFTREAMPSKLPGVIVIHENRGLNPHTEDVARRFALENFMAFAPDALTPMGGYPGDDYKGGELFGKLDAGKRTQDFVAAARWLKGRADCSGQLACTGFCFGGSLTNQLAVILGPDMNAVAPFYGAAPKPEDVGRTKAAVLIHHGALDKNLSGAYPAQEAELKKNNIRYEGHIYPNAVHGFFNDATPERYNRVAAQQAWTRTIEWFNQYARGSNKA